MFVLNENVAGDKWRTAYQHLAQAVNLLRLKIMDDEHPRLIHKCLMLYNDQLKSICRKDRFLQNTNMHLSKHVCRFLEQNGPAHIMNTTGYVFVPVTPTLLYIHLFIIYFRLVCVSFTSSRRTVFDRTGSYGILDLSLVRTYCPRVRLGATACLSACIRMQRFRTSMRGVRVCACMPCT